MWGPIGFHISFDPPTLVFPFKELVERACVVNWMGKHRALLGELGSKLKPQSSTFIESAFCTFARGRGSKNLAKIAHSHTLHWMGHPTVGTKRGDPFPYMCITFINSAGGCMFISKKCKGACQLLFGGFFCLRGTVPAPLTEIIFV